MRVDVALWTEVAMLSLTDDSIGETGDRVDMGVKQSTQRGFLFLRLCLRAPRTVPNSSRSIL